MSHRKHRRQDVKGSTERLFRAGTTANNQITKKKSLGALRKNEKTKPQSPDATGKFHFQRHTLTEIYRQLADSAMMKSICNLACWRNSDQYGPYLTVEISPKFVSFERRRPNGDVHSMTCSMRKMSNNPEVALQVRSSSDMTELSAPLRDSFLLSPRTANYIAALIREGDKFDYSKWLQQGQRGRGSGETGSGGIYFRGTGRSGNRQSNSAHQIVGVLAKLRS